MQQTIKQKLQAIPPQQFLLALLWGLPLAYVHDSGVTSIIIRWALLVSLACLLLLSNELREETLTSFRTLSVLPKLALGVMFGEMLLSTLLSSESWALRLVGWGGENLGVLSWLSFLIIAVGLRNSLRAFLSSRLILVVSGLVCIGSILVDTRLLTHGFRLSGMLLIATSTAIYAAVTLALSLWHLLFIKKNRQLAIAGSVAALATLILCQSRAAQFAALVVCMTYGLYLARHKRKSWVLPLGIAALLIFVPLMGGAYFQRMRGEGIETGVAYRGDIYRLSADEVVHHRILIGLGASGLPSGLNSRNQAPPGILETLNQNYVFLSAHDIFLDTSLYFGLIAGIALLALVLLAMYALLAQAITPEGLLLGGVFFSLLANGLLNVPSIELTSLLFLVVLAVLPPYKRPVVRAKKS